MAVYLRKQRPGMRRFRLDRGCGGFSCLALSVLVTVLVTIQARSWAEPAAAEPVTGSDIVEEYFPDDPTSKDFMPDKPDFGNMWNDDELPLENQASKRIFETLEVTLPKGEVEIIRSVNFDSVRYKYEKKNYENKNPAGVLADYYVKVLLSVFGNVKVVKDDTSYWLEDKFTKTLPFEFNVIAANENDEPLEVIIFVREELTEAGKEDAGYGGEPQNDFLIDVDGNEAQQHYALRVDDKSYHKPFTLKFSEDGFRVSGISGENIFRDVMFARKRNYSVNVLEMSDELLEDYWTANMTVVLRKRTTCLMQVTYDGDLNGGDYGDLAYYNNFLKEGGRYAKQGGVAIATGSGADQDALLKIQSAIGGGQVFSKAEYQAMTGEEVDIFADEPNDPNTTYYKVPAAPTQDLGYTMHGLEDFATGRGEVDKSELETFGLSLAGRKINDTINPVMAFLQTAGSVTIQAASRAKLDEFIKPLPEGQLLMPLSRVMMMTKDRFDDGTPARFSWKAGDGGSAPFIALKPGPGFSGELTADLKSENYRLPDGAYAQIKVKAKFIAAEGAFGCDLGGFR